MYCSILSVFTFYVFVYSNSSPFISGAKLVLYLPASTALNGDIANLNYTLTTPILASWSQENHTIDITIMGNNIDSVDIFFSKNSSLSLPLHGFNEESGLPMIAYVSPSNGSYYEYTAFNTFYPYYIAYGSSLEFSTPAYSGQENDLTITLNLTMALKMGDYFIFSFPRLPSTLFHLLSSHDYCFILSICTEMLKIFF